MRKHSCFVARSVNIASHLFSNLIFLRNKMSNPILYSFDISPPVLAVRSTAAAIGLELENRNIDLTKREHLQEWYLELNPQHTVPTLDDNGSIIWDSHAICTYLIGKYAPNSELYPSDLLQRAKIDQRLYFDASVLFAALKKAQFPVFTQGACDVESAIIDALYAAFDFLESFLQDNDYLVGSSVTLADLCCITSVYSAEAILSLDEQKYPRMMAWLRRLDQLPYVRDVNAASASGYRALIEKNREANDNREA